MRPCPALPSVHCLARLIAAGLLAMLLAAGPARAVDPPYQGQLERLASLMGSLYFLQPLCGFPDINWRRQAAELIDFELPDDDRRARLEGAFNEGYEGFARLYRSCTASARLSMERFLSEGDQIAREIHSRYAE
ncbi:MAG: TIGR02301 family protein [Cucumibacter sp.]